MQPVWEIAQCILQREGRKGVDWVNKSDEGEEREEARKFVIPKKEGNTQDSSGGGSIE